VSLLAPSAPLLAAPPLGTAAAPKPYNATSLNPSGIESAFIAAQGDYFAYVAGFGYEGGDEVGWVNDGSAGAGLGLGSSQKSVAVQLGYNLTTLQADQISGAMDLKVARDLVNNDAIRVALGGGVLDFLTHGKAAARDATAFAVTTIAIPVRIEAAKRTLQFNLGYGGRKFQNRTFPSLLDQGGFGSVGLQVEDNLGLSIGVSSRGVNTTINLVPLRGVPLAIGASANNVADHQGLGRSAVLFFSWGGTYQTASF
jgi:hypothetical protein